MILKKEEYRDVLSALQRSLKNESTVLARELDYVGVTTLRKVVVDDGPPTDGSLIV